MYYKGRFIYQKAKKYFKILIMGFIGATSVWGGNLASKTFMDGEHGW